MVGAKGAGREEFSMALESSAPPRPGPGWVGIGTFRIIEGCQRVREPILSPLLYKTGTLLTVSEEYRVGGPKVRKKFFRGQAGGVERHAEHQVEHFGH